MSPSNHARPAKNGKTHYRHSSANSTSATQASFSVEENDKLLDWIDSLKSRVDSTFDRQKQEHEQLLQEENHERLRLQYRRKISSEAFDQLGQILRTPLQKPDRPRSTRTEHGNAYSGNNSEQPQDSEEDLSKLSGSAHESSGLDVEHERISEGQDQDAESPSMWDGEGGASDEAIEINSDDSDLEAKPRASVGYLQGRPRLSDPGINAEREYYEEDFEHEMLEYSDEAEEVDGAEESEEAEAVDEAVEVDEADEVDKVDEAEEFDEAEAVDEAEEFDGVDESEEFKQVDNFETGVLDSANGYGAFEATKRDYEMDDGVSESAIPTIVGLVTEESRNHHLEKDLGKEAELGDFGPKNGAELNDSIFEDLQQTEVPHSLYDDIFGDHILPAETLGMSSASKVQNPQSLSILNGSSHPEENSVGNEPSDTTAGNNLAEEALAKYSEHVFEHTSSMDHKEFIEQTMESVESIRGSKKPAHMQDVAQHHENDNSNNNDAIEIDGEEKGVILDTATWHQSDSHSIRRRASSDVSANDSMDTEESFITAGNDSWEGTPNPVHEALSAGIPILESEGQSVFDIVPNTKFMSGSVLSDDTHVGTGYSSADDLMRDAEGVISNQAETSNDARFSVNEADIMLNESTGTGDADVVDNPAPKNTARPPTPAFRSISEEPPLETLKTLREAEKRYNIRLESVRSLKIELNLPSESSDSGSMSENESCEPEVSAFLGTKPQVPILEEISDSSEGEFSEDENELSGVYVDEPFSKEETLVVYDDFTEFLPGILLHPSSIEEPEGSTWAHPTLFSRFKFVDYSDYGPAVVPSEVVEPPEPPEDVVVETMEEATDVIVPTFIEEFEEALNEMIPTEAVASRPSRKRTAEADNNLSPFKRIKRVFSTLNPFSWAGSAKSKSKKAADGPSDSAAVSSDQEVENVISKKTTESLAEQFGDVDTVEQGTAHSPKAEVSDTVTGSSDDEPSHRGFVSDLSRPLAEVIEYVDDVVDIPVKPIEEGGAPQESGFQSETIKKFTDALGEASVRVGETIDEPIDEPIDVEMTDEASFEPADQEQSHESIISKLEHSLSAHIGAPETFFESASKVVTKINDVIQEPVDDEPLIDALRKKRAQRLKAMVEGLHQKAALTQHNDDEDTSIADVLRPAAEVADYVESVVECPVVEESKDSEDHLKQDISLTEPAPIAVKESVISTSDTLQSYKEPRSDADARSDAANDEDQSPKESGVNLQNQEDEVEGKEPQSALGVASEIMECIEEVINAALDLPTEGERGHHGESSPEEKVDNNEQFSDALGPVSAVLEYVESAVEAPVQISASDPKTGDDEDGKNHETRNEVNGSEDSGINERQNVDVQEASRNEMGGMDKLERGETDSNGLSSPDTAAEHVQAQAQGRSKEAKESIVSDEAFFKKEDTQMQEGNEDSPKDLFIAGSEALDYVEEMLDNAIQTVVGAKNTLEESGETFKAILDQAVGRPLESAFGNDDSKPRTTSEPPSEIVEEIGSDEASEQDQRIVTDIQQSKIRHFRQEKLQEFANSLNAPLDMHSLSSGALSSLDSRLSTEAQSETDIANEDLDATMYKSADDDLKGNRSKSESEGSETSAGKSVHEDDDSVHEVEQVSVHEDEDSVHGEDDDSVHEVEQVSVHEDEDSVHEDEESVHEDEQSVHEVEESVHEDEDSVREADDSVREADDSVNEADQESVHLTGSPKKSRRLERKKAKNNATTEKLIQLFREKADDALARRKQEEYSEANQTEGQKFVETDTNGAKDFQRSSESSDKGEGNFEESENGSESDTDMADDPDEASAANKSDMHADLPRDHSEEVPTRSRRYLRSMGPAPSEADHVPTPKKEYGHSGEDTEPIVKQEVNDEVNEEVNEVKEEGNEVKEEGNKSDESDEPTEAYEVKNVKKEADSGDNKQRKLREPKSVKVKIEESSPIKKPRRKNRNSAGRYRRQVGTGQEFESPAFRTRSKSPIKRSIQELASEVEGEPIKKRLRGRRKKHPAVTQGEESEVNSRGRGRSRD